MSEMMVTPVTNVGGPQAAPQTAPSAAPADGQVPNAAPERTSEELKLASKFNALTKKERSLLEKQNALKGQEEALARYEAARKGAKLNPMAALQELGLSYEEVTKFLLNGGKPTPELLEKSAHDEVRELREKLEAQERERQAKDAQRGLDTFKANLSQFVETNAEKFELIHTMGATDRVLQTIEQAWVDTGGENGGIVASFDEACEWVEAQLEKEHLARLAKTKKLRSLFEKQAQSAETAGETRQTFMQTSESPFGPTHATQTRPTTLTASAHGARTHPHAERRLSDAERIAEASKFLRWVPG